LKRTQLAISTERRPQIRLVRAQRFERQRIDSFAAGDVVSKRAKPLMLLRVPVAARPADAGAARVVGPSRKRKRGARR